MTKWPRYTPEQAMAVVVGKMWWIDFLVAWKFIGRVYALMQTETNTMPSP